ncbi:MAG: hypothetical protein M1814_005294 [Vezdaea aestivalis]|nr:MAG: hypothetical protein M1814_005294 [Vezdaea aestivalis]
MDLSHATGKEDVDDGLSHIEQTDIVRRKLCRDQCIRWLVTAALIGLIVGTFRVYERKGNMPNVQKSYFNAVIITLTLLLALNFFESFKDQAKFIRWKILGQYKYEIEEVDLIMDFENLVSVAKLGWKCRFNWGISIFCCIWIFLNIIAETSIALINLTSSFNDGKDSNGTYLRAGKVNITDLSCYYRNNSCSPEPINAVIPQFLAHYYGMSTQFTTCRTYQTLSDVLSSPSEHAYYCRRTPGKEEFTYRFLEYNPRDLHDTYPQATNRTISASSGECYEYYEVNRRKGPDQEADGGTAMTFTFKNDTSTGGKITIPIQGDAFRSTTYIYRGRDVPQESEDWRCGDRCLWIWAYKARSVVEKASFFKCPITISSVENGISPLHQVPNRVARLAAASIALQGRHNKEKANKTKNWAQTQAVAFGSKYEVHFQNKSKVGANMAEFAIGSIAEMARRNPRITVNGIVPRMGTSVQIYWRYAIPLLVFIAAFQAVLFISVWIATRDVILRENSYVAISRVMLPLMRHRWPSEGSLRRGGTWPAMREHSGGRFSYMLEGMSDSQMSVGVTRRHTLESMEDVRHKGGEDSSCEASQRGSLDLKEGQVAYIEEKMFEDNYKKKSEG